MSDWLFDLGNSRFKFAPLQGDRAGDVQAWAHGAEGPTQGLALYAVGFAVATMALHLAAAEPHRVEWSWVKGHAGHELNERADQLANRGVAALKAR